MSGPCDLLGQIAHARAQMMLRGHRQLELRLGRLANRDLGEEMETVLDWPEIVRISVRSDMEGFAVMAAAS